MAASFKEGDKVIYDSSNGGNPNWNGATGIVVEAKTQVTNIKLLSPVYDASSVYPTGSIVGASSQHLSLVKESKSALPFSTGGLTSAVEHPAHYGGDKPYEVIKVAEAWGLDKDAYLFNVLKYVARAGKKDPSKELEDLKKGLFYYQRRIGLLEEAAKL